MPDNRDLANDRELESPFHTIVGVGAILCIIAFVGFASSRGGSSAPKTTQTLAVVAPAPVAPASALLATQVEPSKAVEPAKAIEPVKAVEPANVIPNNPAPVVPAVAPSDSVTVPRDLVNEAGLQVELPFGRDAVDRCNKGCSSHAMCETSCLHLMVGEFARRVTSTDPDAQQVARKAQESCQKFSFPEGAQFTAEEKGKMRELLEPPQFYERGPLLERSASAAPFFGRLLPSQHATPLAQTVCLLEATIATELAVADAATARDSYSELFYRHLEGQLLGMINEMKPKVGAELNG